MCTLEILRGLERHNRDAIGQGKKGNFWSVEKFLNDHPAALRKACSTMLHRRGTIIGHHNTFTCGKPIVFHHIGGAESIEC